MSNMETLMLVWEGKITIMKANVLKILVTLALVYLMVVNVVWATLEDDLSYLAALGLNGNGNRIIYDPRYKPELVPFVSGATAKIGSAFLRIREAPTVSSYGAVTLIFPSTKTIAFDYIYLTRMIDPNMLLPCDPEHNMYLSYGADYFAELQNTTSIATSVNYDGWNSEGEFNFHIKCAVNTSKLKDVNGQCPSPITISTFCSPYEGEEQSLTPAAHNTDTDFDDRRNIDVVWTGCKKIKIHLIVQTIPLLSN